MAKHYYSYHRRRSLLDPYLGLFRTHSFPINTVNILTGTVFPVRTGLVTFSCVVNVTGVAPQGIIFEMGSATTGVVVWVASDQKLMAAAGDAAAADGVTLTGPTVVQGQLLHITLAIIPANGKARLWVNGHLVAWGRASGGTLPHGWADEEAGAVGEVNTTVNTRVAVGDRVALDDATIVSSVSAFQNQRPRNFNEVT